MNKAFISVADDTNKKPLKVKKKKTKERSPLIVRFKTF